jgi:hypothetical protein
MLNTRIIVLVRIHVIQKQQVIPVYAECALVDEKHDQTDSDNSEMTAITVSVISYLTPLSLIGIGGLFSLYGERIPMPPTTISRDQGWNN